MKLFYLPRALKLPLILIVTLLCKVNPAYSQASNIVPDDTLGDENSQVIENAGGQPNEVITGGAQRGQNLFHSFQEFNVSEGRGAFFDNPEAVNNIFSRVTGSNPSNILGVLGVDGAANLYLINPNGIVFGANSSLNVQGSFTATTGNGIRFGEQGEFNTIDPQAPQLLTINPSAYLFNQIGDRDISSIESQGDLRVPQGQGEHLVLLGGDISLRGNLVAFGGTVELGSVNDTGEIGISENENLIFSDGVARGDIFLSEGSEVNVSAIGEDGEGFINVYSQNLSLTQGSRIVAGISTGLGDSDTVGGDIIIDALGTVSLLDNALIANVILENAEGTTGKIEVEAESLILNGGLIIADSFARGNAGDIFINATESVIVDGESSRISSYIFPDAEGNAGDISITTGLLEVTNGGLISNDTSGFGEDAGNIAIDATESVEVNGENSDGKSSSITSNTNPNTFANAGNISINTISLKLTNGGLISTDTQGIGEAGNIRIAANESVEVNGENSNRESSSITSSSITSDTDSTVFGNAGNIRIATTSLELTNGGLISTDTQGRGDAGNININASESVEVNGQNSNRESSSITSDTDSNAAGDAGNIRITTTSLELTNGGLISSLISTDTFQLTNASKGQISIDADFVLLENSTISTESNSEGNAGNIELKNFNTLMLENGLITSRSSESSGGEITLDGGDIRLRGNSDIITNVSNGVGGGGNITITADSVIAFDDSDIFAFAQDGEGGNITLNTPIFFGENFTPNSLTSNPELLQNNSRVDLNATGAVSGTVSIPDVSFIQNSLSELPDNSIDTDELLANSCVVPVGDRGQGRFIITGGESLPVRPGDSLPSKYPTGEVRNLPDNDNSWNGDRIVEPQGMYRLTNRKLVLSRECF